MCSASLWSLDSWFGTHEGPESESGPHREQLGRVDGIACRFRIEHHEIHHFCERLLIVNYLYETSRGIISLAGIWVVAGTFYSPPQPIRYVAEVSPP